VSENRTPPAPRPAPRRTLWEEGRRPGRQVATWSTLAVLAAAGVSLLLGDELALLFDVSFVVTCLVAALAVRPRDFFVAGVLPPLLMLGTVTLLAVLARAAVAEEVDGLVQAMVSGMAHHASALGTGYALTLGVLALRQVAVRNAGRLRTFS
jgi:hypothetical protein